jgi:hypothetical protein
MKVYWGIGGIASSILDLSTRWSWEVFFMLWLLYPQGKSPWYPLDRMLGGPESQPGCGGGNNNSQSLQGLKTPIIQSTAQHYTTELSQLK